MARSSLFLAPVATLAIVVGLLFVFSPSASAGSRDGLTVLAQVQQQRAPTGLAAPVKGARVACNGKTSTQCCAGLSYCTCLYSPMGGANPTDCFAGTKPKS